jgi:hypothetical protein
MRIHSDSSFVPDLTSQTPLSREGEGPGVRATYSPFTPSIPAFSAAP